MTSMSLLSLALSLVLLSNVDHYANAEVKGAVKPSAVDNYKVLQGKPVKILSFDDGGGIQFRKKDFKEILNEWKYMPADAHLAVLSIVGEVGSGKSFFMNYLLSHLSGKAPSTYEEMQNLKGGFACGSREKACTRGIWAWSKIIRLPSDPKDIGLIIIDTEGTDNVTVEYKKYAGIFAISTLLSNFQIVNVQRFLKKDDVENLANFVRFAIGNLDAADDAVEKPFHHLMILVQDSNYDEHGKPTERFFSDKFLSELPDEVKQNFRNVSGFLLPSSQDGALFMAMLKSAAESVESSLRASMLASDNWKPSVGKAEALVDIVEELAHRASFSEAYSYRELLDETFMLYSLKQYNRNMTKHWTEYETLANCVDTVKSYHDTVMGSALSEFKQKRRNSSKKYQKILKERMKSAYNNRTETHLAVIDQLSSSVNESVIYYEWEMEAKWDEVKEKHKAYKKVDGFHTLCQNMSISFFRKHFHKNKPSFALASEDLINRYERKLLKKIAATHEQLLEKFEMENERLALYFELKICKTECLADKYNSSAMNETTDALLKTGVWQLLIIDQYKLIKDRHGAYCRQVRSCFDECSSDSESSLVADAKDSGVTKMMATLKGELDKELETYHSGFVSKVEQESGIRFWTIFGSLIEIAVTVGLLWRFSPVRNFFFLIAGTGKISAYLRVYIDLSGILMQTPFVNFVTALDLINKLKSLDL